MRIQFLLKTLLAALVFLLSATISRAQVNETEPNNTPAQANVLPLNGNGNGIINPAGDVDWWKVKTTSDGQLSVTLTPLSGHYMYVVLYDTAGVIQLAGSYGENSFTIGSDGLGAGTYYLQVYGYNASEISSYTISNTFTAVTIPNDKEPDSSRATALNLPLNDSATGHIGYYYNNHKDSSDWYKVTMNADGLLRLTINPVNGQYIYLTLFDNDGVTAIQSLYGASPFGISQDGLAAGTYYVEITPYSSDRFTPYILSDSVFTTGIVNDIEPNNSRAQAEPLSLNATVTGHVNYYYNHYKDSSDWYKVTMNADGLLRLKINPVNGQYIYLTLFDNDGATVIQSVYGESPFGISQDGLAAGTYYVEITPYSSDRFASYILSDSVFTYNKNDAGPNGYFSEAVTIPANRTVTGHVGFYYENVRDTVDTWKINYTGTSGNLNLTFNLFPHNIDGSTNYTYFEVYKDTSVAAIYSNFTESASTPINLTGLAQGYYYIKIFGYSASNFAAYSITDSFTQVNKATVSLAKAASSTFACNNDSLTFNLGASHAPYTVRLYREGVLSDSIITNSSSVSFTGLNDGNYYATVYGDGATDSAYSKTSNTQFLPPTPSGLTTTNVGTHNATLNFTTLSCVKDFTIQYKITGTSSYTIINTASNGPYVLSGLDPNTEYTWRIVSVDSANGLRGNFSDTANFTTTSVLPVTFLNFDGTLINSTAKLTWSTATELNNSGFEVQKSSDGHSFAVIGFVKGSGNSSVVNTYNYTDAKVLSGDNYYRLRQVDIDGNFIYSSIIRLDFKNFDWAVFGNPVTSNSWVQLQIARTSNIVIQILSIDGRVIKTIDKGNISEGTYSVPLNLGNVPSGIYIIRLVADNQSFSKKIIK